nr:Fic family protein [Acetohalobium arabaticum]
MKLGISMPSSSLKIHPFIDGNGRTARLLLNFELMKNGYPPVIIRNDDRASYYETLDKAHTTDDYEDFIKIIREALNRSLDLYLELID